jgi:sulfur carrier protein ThiS
MKIFVERTNEKNDLPFTGTVAELLIHLNINPEEVLVTRAEELLIQSSELKDEDTVKILSIISGG